MFNAKAVLLEKVDGNWQEKEVIIDSIESIRGIFSPYEASVTQVNLSLHKKVYYAPEDLAKSGVEALVHDEDDDRFFLSYKILIVECDSEKPIDISERCLKNIKDAIDFY